MSRDNFGRWSKGFSGNTGNQISQRTEAYFKNALSEYEKEFIQYLVDLASNKYGDTKCSTRLKAIMFVLEQLHGKARQSVEIVQNDVIDIEHMSTVDLLKSINQLKLEIEEDKKRIELMSDSDLVKGDVE